MFKFFDKVKKSKAGYTLTELIVVVAILGILAAIGIPAVMSALSTSKANADDTSIKAIETAVQMCLAGDTLTMVSGVIKDKDGGTDAGKIRAAVKDKLVGGVYPKHQANNKEKWQLSLATGKVVSTTADESAGGTVNLDS